VREIHRHASKNEDRGEADDEKQFFLNGVEDHGSASVEQMPEDVRRRLWSTAAERRHALPVFGVDTRDLRPLRPIFSKGRSTRLGRPWTAGGSATGRFPKS
jgi:hypothetical protein